MLSGLKLAMGQAWSAWREYPGMRRALLAAAPGPPILVTGMYRTGTTWVGAMLAPAGLWHLHEPFNPNRGMWPNELEYATADAPRPALDAFVARLLRGRHRAALRLPRSGRWFAPLRLLPVQPRRVLIKDPSASLLAEYLVRRHGMQALVLFRHPAAVASSVLRLGWPTGDLVALLLADEELMEGPLAELRSDMQAATGRKDALSATVLYGCVARVLWAGCERNAGSMVRLSFEDLCRDPRSAFRSLFDRLGLPYDTRVAELHARLTAEAPPGPERPHGIARASGGMAWAWRERVGDPDLATIRRTWERFEIPLYRDASTWNHGVAQAR